MRLQELELPDVTGKSILSLKRIGVFCIFAILISFMLPFLVVSGTGKVDKTLTPAKMFTVAVISVISNLALNA